MCPSASHAQMALTVKEPEISSLQDHVMQVSIVHLANIINKPSAAVRGIIVQPDHRLNYYVHLESGKMKSKSSTAKFARRDTTVIEPMDQLWRILYIRVRMGFSALTVLDTQRNMDAQMERMETGQSWYALANVWNAHQEDIAMVCNE